MVELGGAEGLFRWALRGKQTAMRQLLSFNLIEVHCLVHCVGQFEGIVPSCVY